MPTLEKFTVELPLENSLRRPWVPIETLGRKRRLSSENKQKTLVMLFSAPIEIATHVRVPINWIASLVVSVGVAKSRAVETKLQKTARLAPLSGFLDARKIQISS